MMKELYDITVLFLRCLRNFEKWSWILILRKNEGKMRKNRVKWLSLSPQIYTTLIRDHIILNWTLEVCNSESVHA